ncbi:MULTISPECIES: nucleotidyltransferase family protein [unclassified Mesotoga]|uniref:nucleotidyltransferase family protein n=1 Tax=unclassified Mesotoga TaxID=1184398 RepID=UPI000DA6672E|nr:MULTISPECIES: nucleotidyltransferase family protein [unclassified Mesotoga]PZC52132.1 DNA polymerase beta [Mesotoga sp. TolDC]
MEGLDQILSVLKDKMSYFRSRYQIESLRVFGSYARGEQNEESDLDLLVRFEESAQLTLIDYIDLRNELSNLLSVKIDLVDESTLKPLIGENILREAIEI